MQVKELNKEKEIKAEKFLENMDKAILWNEIESPIKAKYYENAGRGRPKIELKTMLKVHFIQKWFGLSDPQTEEQIYDRISFRKFLNIEFGMEIPDETSICKFRKFLNENNYAEKLEEIVLKILEKHSLIVKEGKIVDATIIQASGSTKNKAKERDKEMGSTMKNNNYYFGLKHHIATCIKGFVLKVITTKASKSDVSQLELLLDGNEKMVCGDKAYGNEKLKKRLEKTGGEYKILSKKPKGKDMPEEVKAENKEFSKVRFIVEFPFGVIKNLWHNRRVRYKGIEKNHKSFLTMCSLFNIYKARNTLILANS